MLHFNGCLVETTLMPVDIRKAYFELQQLRKEVRKAEREFIRSFARSSNRSVRKAAAPDRTSHTVQPQMPVLKRALN
jgi:hypothetical protein